MKVQRDGFRQSEFADDQGSQTRLARDPDTKQSDDGVYAGQGEHACRRFRNHLLRQMCF